MPATALQQNLDHLAQIVTSLRAPDGCPWDRVQTPTTLKPYILEEACELIEALDRENPADICDELGDLLLQIVFIAEIFHEQGRFGLADVIKTICAKMIRRHPHVFADDSNEGHGQRWEAIKNKERRESGKQEGLAQALPATLPALKRTQKLYKKLGSQTPEQVLTALDEARTALATLLRSPTAPVTEREAVLAQLLSLSAQLAQSLHLDAEEVLRSKTTAKIREIDDRQLHQFKA
jgi:MazG family protein